MTLSIKNGQNTQQSSNYKKGKNQRSQKHKRTENGTKKVAI